MIPTLLLVGLAMGLLPRQWPVVGVLASGVIWALLLVVTGPVSEPASAVGAFVLGVVNAGVGALATWLLKRVVNSIIDGRIR